MKKFLLFSWLIIYGQVCLAQNVSLMPMPQEIKKGSGKIYIEKTFKVSIEGDPNDRIYPEVSRFLQRLSNQSGIFLEKVYYSKDDVFEDVSLKLVIQKPGKVQFGEDESYQLDINTQSVNLRATTDLGAIHGLETLLQLMQSDDIGSYFPVLSINDKPRFPWRGIMIDVARHFQPVEVIKRNIDGMSAVKMNVLHLHLSEDQGYRVESKKFPLLTDKSSDGFYFTQEQIKDIVAYADQRGIRVYPEIDVPGHATAILTAYPELASKNGKYELIRDAGIFDSTLDPTNPKTYEFLYDLFTELVELFPDEYFHIGGDENEGKHWNENETIQNFMKENNLKDNHELQAHFNTKLMDHLTSLNKKMVGWDEIIHKDLPNTAIIQSWRGLDNMKTAAKMGYKTMLSNGYYIDLLHSVDEHYLVDPIPVEANLSDEEKSNIIGGEATMWSELVTPLTIDSRIWPRSAAIAERLWSSANVKDIDDMHERLAVVSKRLEQVGLTHLSSREVIFRNLANGSDTAPLNILSDVCQPLQGYTRNPGGTMYKSFSPFTLFADACIADPPAARIFDRAIGSFISGKMNDKQTILEYLNLWESNHSAIEKMAKNRPMISEVLEISSNLSKLSTCGKDALNLIEYGKKPKSDWVKESKALVLSARTQGARTELKVVDGIERLITLASKK